MKLYLGTGAALAAFWPWPGWPAVPCTWIPAVSIFFSRSSPCWVLAARWSSSGSGRSSGPSPVVAAGRPLGPMTKSTRWCATPKAAWLHPTWRRAPS